MAEKLIEIKISGENLSPATIRAKELAAILVNAEEMIISTIINADHTIKKEEIIIGLVSIEKGSVDLCFESQSPQLVYSAYEKLTQAIRTDNYVNISEPSIEAIGEFVAFSKKHNCITEFGYKNGNSQILAKITPQTNISSSEYFWGETTIYGYVQRVGGKKPSVKVKTISGQNLVCTTTQEIAKKVGSHLYNWVGLSGIASWDNKTLRINSFKISEITEYEETDNQRVFDMLSSNFGEYFEDIENPDEFVNKLRNEE